MKTNCTICNHPKRKDIDQALIQKVVTKESFPMIAQRFNVSKDSLFNHYKKHLPKLPITVEQPQEIIETCHNVVTILQELIKDCDYVLEKAKENDKFSFVLQAIQAKSNIILRVLDIKTKQSQREANDDMPLDVRCCKCNTVKFINNIIELKAYWNVIKEHFGEEISKEIELLYFQQDKNDTNIKPNPWTKNNIIDISNSDLREYISELKKM